MGLNEKRKIKELQETVFPGRTKEIEEICGKAIAYDVDWNSLAEDLETNPRVSVSYCDPGRGLYVSLSGFARFVYDPERILALWDERVSPWFPLGPSDSRLGLLLIDVDHAEYWDEPSSRMVRLLARAQAKLRRDPSMPPAEHERLDLRKRPTGTRSAP